MQTCFLIVGFVAWPKRLPLVFRYSSELRLVRLKTSESGVYTFKASNRDVSMNETFTIFVTSEWIHLKKIFFCMLCLSSRVFNHVSFFISETRNCVARGPGRRASALCGRRISRPQDRMVLLRAALHQVSTKQWKPRHTCQQRLPLFQFDLLKIILVRSVSILIWVCQFVLLNFVDFGCN